MATARSDELRRLAQRLVDALPPSVVREAVLTGSVSRGVADAVSDVEILLVADELPAFDVCCELAAEAGLRRLDTWAPPEPPAYVIGGRGDGCAVELIWWSRAHAEERLTAIVAGEILDRRLAAADALAHGVPLRTTGLLARWQEQLARYPDELAERLILGALWLWRGYDPAGFLTLARPGERVPLIERLVEDAQKVVRIVFALNRTWEPSLKRLRARVEPLATKPERLGDRLELALTDTDPVGAIRTMYELVAETLDLVPPSIDVAAPRAWVDELLEVVR